ncbi:helix-turn-helix domain-containing protein [Dapis sp. BLCC M229]|uniref:helix-turn-helix domain-containing protein n=1 Tax=Dapis sp. BLCC M229 TaxID=3400188 RepID=UPI003CE7D38C
MTLTMNYCYRLYPDPIQEQTILHWLEISRKVYNYALREIKDWVNSRKCSLDYSNQIPWSRRTEYPGTLGNRKRLCSRSTGDGDSSV